MLTGLPGHLNFLFNASDHFQTTAKTGLLSLAPLTVRSFKLLELATKNRCALVITRLDGLPQFLAQSSHLPSVLGAVSVVGVVVGVVRLSNRLARGIRIATILDSCVNLVKFTTQLFHLPAIMLDALPELGNFLAL